MHKHTELHAQVLLPGPQSVAHCVWQAMENYGQTATFRGPVLSFQQHLLFLDSQSKGVVHRLDCTYVCWFPSPCLIQCKNTT